MTKPIQQIANDLMTLRRMTSPKIYSLSNTTTLVAIRLLIDTMTNLLLAVQTIEERTDKP